MSSTGALTPQQRSRVVWWRDVKILTLILAPLLALLLMQADSRIVTAFSDDRLPGDIAKAIHLSEAFGHGTGVIAIFGVLLTVDRSKRRHLVFAAIAVAATMGIANVSKSFFERTRPYAVEDLTRAADGTDLSAVSGDSPWRWDSRVRSFPSGHSATAIAMALALSQVYPRGRFWFAGLGLLACLQRIVSGAHYPSDVLAGMTIAAVVAVIFQTVLIRFDLLRPPVLPGERPASGVDSFDTSDSPLDGIHSDKTGASNDKA